MSPLCSYLYHAQMCLNTRIPHFSIEPMLALQVEPVRQAIPYTLRMRAYTIIIISNKFTLER